MDIVKAQSLIIGYPEIATVTISLSPWWYTTLPSAQSRITIRSHQTLSVDQ